jgi:hypothetical protein
MTVDPIRTPIDHHSPTARLAGQIPAAPKPINAADLVPLHADNPPSDVDQPDPNVTAALVRRQAAPSNAAPAAQRIAKSP